MAKVKFSELKIHSVELYCHLEMDVDDFIGICYKVSTPKNPAKKFFVEFREMDEEMLDGEYDFIKPYKKGIPWFFSNLEGEPIEFDLDFKSEEEIPMSFS